jgi:alpha-tubulin suppressor-like RCC1 family protein
VFVIFGSVAEAQNCPQGPRFVPIAAGESHTVALKPSGTVGDWGDNEYGQLGDGTTNNNSRPVAVSGLTRFIAVSAGSRHTAALKSDGTVWTWGSNQFGPLGDGTTTDGPTPVAASGVGLDGAAVAVACGPYHNLALATNGWIWAWGFNFDGELGLGPATYIKYPDPVAAEDGAWVGIAAGGYHSLALRANGTVWATGGNDSGQLGNGTTTGHVGFYSVSVSGLSGVMAIAAGSDHSVALKSNGTVWTWGANYAGQLGDGTTTNHYTPIQVGGLSGMTAIAAGGEHTVALKSDGTVWSWGATIGDGTTTNHLTPAQASGLSGVVAIAAGYSHTVALKSDGTIWAWGGNVHGELGDGTTTTHYTPVQVSGLTGLVPNSIWVDFAYSGIENGCFNTPYNTLAEATNAVPIGGNIEIKAGATNVTITLTKPMRIGAYGGAVTIGQ